MPLNLMPKLTKFWNDEDLWEIWKLKEHLVCCPSLKSEAKCPHLSKYFLTCERKKGITLSQIIDSRLAVVKLRTLAPIPFGVFRFLSLFIVKSFGLLPLLYSKLRKTPDNWLLLKIPKIIQATQFHLTFWWYKLRILVIISFSFLLQLAYFTFLPVWLSL